MLVTHHREEHEICQECTRQSAPTISQTTEAVNNDVFCVEGAHTKKIFSLISVHANKERASSARRAKSKPPLFQRFFGEIIKSVLYKPSGGVGCEAEGASVSRWNCLKAFREMGKSADVSELRSLCRKA